MSSSTLPAPDLSSGVFTDTPPRDIAVSVRGLSKSYRIARNAAQHTSAGEAIMHKLRHPFEKVEHETFWALNDVSFDIQKGDVVGIIGRNGAGKSTLLKILSRITEPTKGRIDLYGRVGSLLEVGTGFHPELTGRENIFLNGAILGMKKSEIARQFDAIVDFSGTEQFLDTPVKRYSSGMYVRLAFAVAAHLNPEILIIDEVLAVGDAEFQKKCLGKMQDVAASGRTVLLVSHNMAAIQNLCMKCLFLQSGTVSHFGSTQETLARYVASSRSNVSQELSARTDRSGTGEVRCIAIKLLDAKRQVVETVQSDKALYMEVLFESKIQIRDLKISIDIDTLDGTRLTTLYSGFHNHNLVIRKGLGRATCFVDGLNLRPDRYSLNIMLGHDHGQYDFLKEATVLEVAEADVFQSGRMPERVHGPFLVQYNWVTE